MYKLFRVYHWRSKSMDLMFDIPMVYMISIDELFDNLDVYFNNLGIYNV